MNESNNEIEKTSLDNFPNWELYQSEQFLSQIKKFYPVVINKQEPQEKRSLQKLSIDGRNILFLPANREDLRSQIKENMTRLSEEKLFYLTIILNFLEKGIMIDHFGNNEEARHDFLLKNKIQINGKEMTLYEISKNINKLSGNAVATIITLAYEFNEFRAKAEELTKTIGEIKRNRGYFLPEDLEQVNELATNLFNYLISN